MFWQWLVVHSRAIFLTLLSFNFVLGVALVTLREPLDLDTSALQAPLIEERITLLTEIAQTVDEAPSAVDLDATSSRMAASVVADPEIQEGVAQNPRSLDEQVPEGARPLEKVTPARECRVWGPRSSSAAFADLSATLENQGAFPEVFETQVQSEPDYMVYVRDLGSADNAQRVGRELKEQKVDSFVTRRDGAVVLSVGVFSNQQYAKRQFDRLAQWGFDMGMEEIARTQTVYNLRGYVSPDSELFSTSVSPCLAIAQSP